MRLARSISISPDSVEIHYMDDTSDLRAGGQVLIAHTISMSREDPELEEQMEDLETAVATLLDAGIRRWAQTLPVTPQDVNERLRAQSVEQFDDDEDEDDGEG